MARSHFTEEKTPQETAQSNIGAPSIIFTLLSSASSPSVSSSSSSSTSSSSSSSSSSLFPRSGFPFSSTDNPSPILSRNLSSSSSSSSRTDNVLDQKAVNYSDSYTPPLKKLSDVKKIPLSFYAPFQPTRSFTEDEKREYRPELELVENLATSHASLCTSLKDAFFSLRNLYRNYMMTPEEKEILLTYPEQAPTLVEFLIYFKIIGQAFTADIQKKIFNLPLIYLKNVSSALASIFNERDHYSKLNNPNVFEEIINFPEGSFYVNFFFQRCSKISILDIPKFQQFKKWALQHPSQKEEVAYILRWLKEKYEKNERYSRFQKFEELSDYIFTNCPVEELKNLSDHLYQFDDTTPPTLFIIIIKHVVFIREIRDAIRAIENMEPSDLDLLMKSNIISENMKNKMHLFFPRYPIAKKESTELMALVCLSPHQALARIKLAHCLTKITEEFNFKDYWNELTRDENRLKQIGRLLENCSSHSAPIPLSQINKWREHSSADLFAIYMHNTLRTHCANYRVRWEEKEYETIKQNCFTLYTLSSQQAENLLKIFDALENIACDKIKFIFLNIPLLFPILEDILHIIKYVKKNKLYLTECLQLICERIEELFTSPLEKEEAIKHVKGIAAHCKQLTAIGLEGKAKIVEEKIFTHDRELQSFLDLLFKHPLMPLRNFIKVKFDDMNYIPPETYFNVENAIDLVNYTQVIANRSKACPLQRLPASLKHYLALFLVNNSAAIKVTQDTIHQKLSSAPLPSSAPSAPSVAIHEEATSKKRRAMPV